MPITARQLRNMNWRLAFEYDNAGTHFQVFKSESHDGIAVIHEKTPGRKTRIIYNARGSKTDSPSNAVRLYNEAEKREILGSGHYAAGSPESIAARKGALR